MKAKTVYEASDGREFDTVEACRDHEQELTFALLTGLDGKAITDTLAGHRPDLAAAFEKIGARLAEARRAAGGSKRKKKEVAAQ